MNPFLLPKLSLYSLPADQTITSLGAVLSVRPGLRPLPDEARKICSSMLGAQLLREDGISGLLSAMFGDAEGSEGESS